MNQLSKAILRILIYFDLFDYPLTLMELGKWLNVDNADKTRIARIKNADDPQITRGYRIEDIAEALDQLSDKVSSQDGFYFLTGRQSIIQTRLSRYNISEAKFKRAVKFIKVFSQLPFVKMIAVCNTLAYSNSSRSGDIDLFIITKNNRLWLARFLIVGLLKLLHVRPTKIKKQDAIDAAFFLAEEDLNIAEIKINQADIYLTYWIDQLVPIFNIDNTYQKFQQANQWIKKSLPYSSGYQLGGRRQVLPSRFAKIIGWLLNLFLNWQLVERWAKKYQLKIMPLELKSIMNLDSRVVVNDKMLKFHRSDRRQEYQERFFQAVGRLRI